VAEIKSKNLQHLSPAIAGEQDHLSVFLTVRRILHPGLQDDTVNIKTPL
jgi:hypothetical protein